MQSLSCKVHSLLKWGITTGLLFVLVLPAFGQNKPKQANATKTKVTTAKPSKTAKAEQKKYDPLLRKSEVFTSLPVKIQRPSANRRLKSKYEHVLERFKMLRAYPFDDVNKTNYAQELMRARQVPPATLQQIRGNQRGNGAAIAAAGGGSLVGPAAGINMPRWQFVGPTAISAGGNSPWVGRINALTFEPGNSRTIYVGGANGGVWKSVNNGTSWTAITDLEQGQSISEISIDTNNPNVVYVGTGDHNGGVAPGFGILFSNNAGNTWTNLDPFHSNFGFANIRTILINPDSFDPNIGRSSQLFVAATNSGVFRSDDGGTTWAQVFNPQGACSRLSYNTTRTIIYVAVDEDGIYSSDDNGNTWNQVLSGGGERMDVAASKTDPNTVYALDAANEQVLKSIDAGATWSSITSGLMFDSWGQSFYDFYIACSVKNNARGVPPSDAVWVGLISLFQSPDGGRNWQDAGLVYKQGERIHPDQHCIAFNTANNNDGLVGGDGGVYRMTYISQNPVPNPFSFVPINRGLGITQFYFGANNPVNQNMLIGGTQDNGTPQANGSVATWRLVTGGDGFGVAINPSDPFNATPGLRGWQNQYSTIYDNLVFVTEDNWQNQLAIPIPAPSAPEFTVFFTPLVMNLKNPLWVYTATNTSLYHYNHPVLDPATPNTNTSWNRFGQDMRDPNIPNDAITAIGTSDQNANILATGTRTGVFWYTRDHGSTWIRVDRKDQIPTSPNSLPRRPITNIVFSSFNLTPNLPQRARIKVWVTLGGAPGFSRVWVCDDITRVDILGNPIPIWRPLPNNNLPDITPLKMVKLPYDNESTFYIGTDAGVYITTDACQSWQDAGFSLGLPNTIVNDMTFVPSTGALYAYTYGRGVWKLQAGDTSTLNIYPYLEEYRGSRSKFTATLEFYRASDNFPLEIRQVRLSSSGHIITPVSFVGAVNIRVRIPGFLSVWMPSIPNGTTNLATPLMRNGDVDRTNSVANPDALAVRQRLNTYWTGPEDVNGDGRVNQTDLNIVLRNLGAVGQ